jgi:hypothetical protein
MQLKPILIPFLADELRKRDHPPVLFGFDKPSNRDITESVSTMAHMARFVIANIADIPPRAKNFVPGWPSSAKAEQPCLVIFLLGACCSQEVSMSPCGKGPAVGAGNEVAHRCGANAPPCSGATRLDDGTNFLARGPSTIVAPTTGRRFLPQYLNRLEDGLRYAVGGAARTTRFSIGTTSRAAWPA